MYMKYLLKKDLPWIQSGKIFEENNCQPTYSRQEINWELFVWPKFANNYPDFFEPIVEKKTYDDLKKGDGIYLINYTGFINERYFENDCRSETFLTRQEAEDEHKRREWAVRKDRFIPNKNECYFYPSTEWEIEFSHNDWYSTDYMMINAGLVFETRQECQDAIDNHDIVRLFYTIR